MGDDYFPPESPPDDPAKKAGPNPAIVDIRDAKGRFGPGNSIGHSGGRPKGSLNKTTILAMQLLDHEASNIVEVAIQMAKDGNTDMIKTVLDKIIPRRSAPVDININNGPALDFSRMSTEQIEMVEQAMLLMTKAQGLDVDMGAVGAAVAVNGQDDEDGDDE